ncbi:uncharacterized protein BYT42DRAFT_349712 [Radiomyces spectabilis]|uniref:uncharacterized protein n=1 Tax=Radiomyces spectabilis TaxID=64574 RepID=UPI00221EC2CB|nr:uncharacterized protein BYT42DRAFT_349712 [Radiomyces spectabilis]KAI8377583.1 hypothetical protein BYT42DRAFT_349712 [Radiomyces spectabilis]
MYHFRRQYATIDLQTLRSLLLKARVPLLPARETVFAQTWHAVDCIFTRRKLESLPQLAIENFTTAELDRAFHLWGVDPGITEIFAVNDGHGQQTHQIRRCSTAEFYHNSGVKKSAAKMLAMKQQTLTDGRSIADIERDLPSRKSSPKANIIRYAQELSRDLNSMLNFYDDRFSSLRFWNYIGKQKAGASL